MTFVFTIRQSLIAIRCRYRLGKSLALPIYSSAVGREPDPPIQNFLSVQEHCPPKNQSSFANRYSLSLMAQRKPRLPTLFSSLVPHPESLVFLAVL